MEDEQNTADAEDAAVPWSTRRRWVTGVLAALVVLALITFVPGPVARANNVNAARQLVDETATGRAELLAKQDEIRTPLAGLGAPLRSWTQVSCWLTPRYSDGDGQSDVVMYYWQHCTLDAYEIYASPADATDAAEVASLLRGRTAGEPTCSEILFDVLSPDYGASTSDAYSAALWWVDPHGEPPPDRPDHCAVPAPDDPDAARVVQDVEGSETADASVIYRVSSPIVEVDVGCAHRLPWIIACDGEPDGFPVY